MAYAKNPLSQNQQVRSHLLEKGSITPLEALGLYRVFRLAAVIFTLRKQGVFIDTELTYDRTGKPYARYVHLTSKPKTKPKAKKGGKK